MAMILVFFGMTASGKSTLAQACAERYGAPCYNTDRVRKELAGLPATAHRPDAVGQGIYSHELSTKTYEALLRKAKEEAERANEAKSVFLAKMNHQLRTPLNAVIGYSEILLEDAEANGEESQIPDLQRINSAGRHLLSLVTDVLDVGKIVSEDVELIMSPLNLGNFIDDVESTCRSLITINGNEFSVEKGENLGSICADW